MQQCYLCHGSGVLAPVSVFGIPLKCHRCAGTGQIDHADLRPGDHVCYLYKDREQQLSTISKLLADGIKNNERCVYCASDWSDVDIMSAMDRHGIDAAKERERGALLFFGAEETYLRKDALSSGHMLSLIQQLARQALRDGYSALRITGETGWLNKSAIPGTELSRYEAAVKEMLILEQPRVIAICQYSLDHFPDALMNEVRSAHRFVFQD